MQVVHRRTGDLERCDCAQHGLEGWHAVAGRWGVEDMPGAPSGQLILVQRAVENACTVMVAPSASSTDVEVAVQCKPMAGTDAAGGIVLRCAEGQYAVVRANALEDNVRLYASERGRHQLAAARVPPPALGQWPAIRVAVGEHSQASRHGVLLLEHRDARSRTGQVGLSTTADAMTAFDALVIHGVPGT